MPQQAAKKATQSAKKLTRKKNIIPLGYVDRLNQKRKSFLSRRPHRSFKLTRRRDYKRSLTLPGYWSLTYHVHKTLWSHKAIFTKIILFYMLLIVISVGLLSQDNYTTLSQSAQEIGFSLFDVDPGDVINSLAVFSGIFVGSVSAPFLSFSDSQRILFGFSMVFIWLAVVWVLRSILANKKVSFRDAIYSSGGPIIPTLLVIFVLLLQIVPVSLAVISYFIAEQTGLFLNPLATTLFWVISGLMSVISIYGVVSSLIALVVVTLPGMYPLHALKAAGDIAVGRRVRILLRYTWLLILLLIGWLIILLPTIALASISFLKNIPLIPIVILALSSISVVWSASYIYILYRRIVDDNAPPA